MKKEIGNTIYNFTSHQFKILQKCEKKIDESDKSTSKMKKIVGGYIVDKRISKVVKRYLYDSYLPVIGLLSLEDEMYYLGQIKARDLLKN